jgi:hypothetical protein
MAALKLSQISAASSPPATSDQVVAVIGGTTDNLVSVGQLQGAPVSINTQTASYTLVLGDAGKIVEMNVASANTLTVPTNASVAFPIGTNITINQNGAGLTTIVAAGGVTIDSFGGALKMEGQYAGASLYKRGTNEWVLTGAITP